MADLNGFNASEIEPIRSYDPIPAGKYLAAITSSEIKPTKNGNGSYLQLAFTILEGEFVGRLVWTRLTLEHENATAVKIARANLAAICRAVGVLTPKDSVELHNLPLVIRVACKQRADTGELVNEIKGYEPRVYTPPQIQSSSPPWRR